MGFWANLFQASESDSGSVNYWRSRASALEDELKKERSKREAEATRNRKREDLLLDRVILSKGQVPISKQAERELGFNAELPQKTLTLTPEERTELEAFVESSVNGGVTRDEAEKFWLESERGKE
jgi:hypothetical protein